MTLFILGNLKFLTWLDISFNSFNGLVPSSVCSIANNPNASVYICGAAAVNSSEGCGAIAAVPSCLFPNSPTHRIGNLSEYFVGNTTSRPTFPPSLTSLSQNYTMCSLAEAWNVSGWECSAGFPTDICSGWPGIECKGAFVSSISLVYYGILGSIPTALGPEYCFLSIEQV